MQKLNTITSHDDPKNELLVGATTPVMKKAYELNGS
jgi:hypothetical protein